MKRIKIILGLVLFASVTTFAQSPRIKLNQITKDTVKGSVLISSPSDSGMVYSRDFYVAYGADTVLILYGDTLAATSGIISSVLSDGVTITGDGTSGNELKVDTSLIATIKALNDSLSTISASTTPDGVTITGDGSVGNPLKVDTLLISTIQGLVDTLTARGYLTANQTITLSGDVTGSGTTAITATVVDDSHNHIISNVDFLQDSLTAKANASELSNYLLTSNYIVDSTRINATGDTAFYYQNGLEIGSQAIAGGGGTSYNNISETADTVFVSKFLNVDTATLYVNADSNRVGIGTNSPQAPLSVAGSIHMLDVDQTDDTDNTLYIYNDTDANSTDGTTNAEFFMQVAKKGSGGTDDGPYFGMRGNDYSRSTNQKGRLFFHAGDGMPKLGTNGTVQFYGTHGIDFRTGTFSQSMFIEDDGGILMPDVYSDLISGTTRDLYIKDDGQLGYISSTAKSKTNIYDLNNVDFIYNLNPVSFNYRKQNDNGEFTDEFYEKTSYGLIAEEVVNVADYMVYYDELEDGGFIPVGVNYSELITPMLKAIQQQKDEIDQLKTLITDLTNRLTILENK